MAAAKPERDLHEAVICSICLDYFKDPQLLKCGHNFCRSCITHCRDKSCPQCRKPFQEKHFQPNRELRNIAEIAKKFLDSRETRACEQHQEPLKLFCKVDQTPICLVCREADTHREHRVVPIEEVAQGYKNQIESRLKNLKKEREKILSFRLSGEKESQKLQRQLETEKQKIVSEFWQLHQFLKKQEQLLLGQLEVLNKEIEKSRDEYVARLSKEESSFSDLICEMELKCQLPASEFLQDIKGTLNRCEKTFENLTAFSFARKWRIKESSQNCALLETEVKKFKESLQWDLESKKVTVTLDPDTAHPQLVLFEDGKCMRREKRRQDLPNNPERFDITPCVLGREGFTSGRHCWEVEVEDGQFWAVGVASESVRRKGRIRLSPKEEIWALEMRVKDPYEALLSLFFWPYLPMCQLSRRIWVCLDCDRGQVTFFNAGEEAPILTFPPGSVPGGRLRPWFWVGKASQLRLCP